MLIKIKTMHSKLLMLMLLTLLSAAMKAQIPNGDFENWTIGNNYDMPVNWDNLNPITSIKNVFTCERGVEKSTGNVYLRLVSDSVEGMGVAPGIAVCGTLDMVTLKPKSGFPCTQRPSALTGKWQFMAQGNDPGFIAVYFTKWNTVSKKRDVIGTGVDTLKGMAMTWTSFSIPITFSSAVTPDSCIIFLSASSTVPIQYSYLFVDDLSFDTSSDVYENAATAKFKSFPNPVQNVLHINLNALADIQGIQIVNLQGQVVCSPATNQHMQVMDVNFLATGIYFIRVITKNAVMTQRFEKL
jgi:hypothetical protein